MSDIKNKRVHRFLEDKKGDLKVIRSVLLFGKNVYSYKFPFCEAFLTIGAKDRIHQEEIFGPFLEALLRHMRTNPYQYQGGSADKEPSTFMKLCLGHLEGKIEKAKVEQEAERIIPRNVFDAFQNIGGGTLSADNRLYEFDKATKYFSLKPLFLELLSDENTKSLIKKENEGRWRVVEEAWRAGIPVGIISLDPDDKIIYHDVAQMRIPLRGAVDLLMSYQKGTCFYCDKKLNQFAGNMHNDFPDVDHYFSLDFIKGLSGLNQHLRINPNGIWNLVIACRECNRGPNGKFHVVADRMFLPKLIERNEYYVEEHKHAFRFAVFESLGIGSDSEIRDKILKIDNECLTTRWKPRKVVD